MKRALAAILTMVMLGTACGAQAAAKKEGDLLVTSEVVYQRDGSELSYMKFELGSNEKIEKTLNESIAALAQSVIDWFLTTSTQIDVGCSSVSLAGGAILSMQFSGTRTEKDAKEATPLYFTANFDLTSGKLTQLNSHSDADVITDIILKQSDKLVSATVNGVKADDKQFKEQKQYLSDLGEKMVLSQLKDADVKGDGKSWPAAFSYWSGEGTCIISIEVPHAMGDYAHFEFAYSLK